MFEFFCRIVFCTNLIIEKLLIIWGIFIEILRCSDDVFWDNFII